MRVIIDYERAGNVLDLLLARFRRGEYPYNTAEGQPPQLPKNMPREGFANDRDRACFFILLCLYMRGKIKSDVATRGMSRIYETRPDLFQPEIAMNADSEIIYELLKKNGLGFASFQNSRFWVENMRRVQVNWAGDPRNVFVGATDYDDLCQRICNNKTRRKRVGNPLYKGFVGFQKKMTSMLAYFFLDAKLIAPLQFPWPVDFHVQRIFISHRALIFPGSIQGDNLQRQEVMDAARQIGVWYAEHRNVDPVHMSELLWCFSRSMCAYHPGNVSKYIGPRKGRQTVIQARPVKWSKAQSATFHRTCGQCPIEKTCTSCIPAGPYYNHGLIIIRARRDRPPQQEFFQLSPPKRQTRDWKKETQAPQENKDQTPLFEPKGNRMP